MDPGFQTFSTEHLITLLVFIAFTILMIKTGRRGDERTKIRIGFTIASASQAVLIIDLGLRVMTHTLDVLNDLPFFLCDLVALILPFIILRQDRKWLGILYFWAVGGTMQALITPELDSGFPTFEFFRYFIMHGGIVAAVIYAVIVFQIRISWKDLWNAVLYVQVYLVGIHLVNILLGSNYSYTMAKPGSDTVLNFLGDWPWYILATEIVMILLFILLLTPFLLFHANKEQEKSLTSGQMD
ncbi:MAG TPA: TIGR02206 family membrane protein [Saprospiraceae bacterium]|nr:TIGR02206 family membrane protein [Saprospiraceae bacterium]